MFSFCTDDCSGLSFLLTDAEVKMYYAIVHTVRSSCYCPQFPQCEMINLSLHVLLFPVLTGHRPLAQAIAGQRIGSLNYSVIEIPQVLVPLLIQFPAEAL